MDALDKLKKKNAPQVSIALMRMKPMSRKEAATDSMSYRDDEGNMEENKEMVEDKEMAEDKEEYGSESCPKCAEYQMLIGEALAMYMRNKDKEEASDSEVE
jgi:hypothetical protein